MLFDIAVEIKNIKSWNVMKIMFVGLRHCLMTFNYNFNILYFISSTEENPTLTISTLGFKVYKVSVTICNILSREIFNLL